MIRRDRRIAWLVCAAVLACAPAALAFEFRSIGDSAAVMYDAPSSKAKKLYVVGRSYPVEVVVVVEGWSKVRDASGELAWVETRLLVERRTVVVKARLAEIRQSAEDSAPAVFQAEQNVVLELLEIGVPGWIRVRHRDGQSGYVRTSQIWGA